uniref:ARAD1D36850p n=1 Tax=Blastobotrys adeninivorans TaxID=409370 RepID=A0A060TH88_BLAAD
MSNTAKNDKRKKGPPVELTPEYIAEMRALREARKKAKKEAQGEKAPEPQQQERFNYSFIKRPVLDIPGATGYPNGHTFKIMTYNALAQSLIRRDLFPENGEALKWKYRGQVLKAEIGHYKPDVLCMQEVDANRVSSFWSPELEKLGMECQFTTFPGKAHGQIIAFNKKIFRPFAGSLFKYDEIESGKAPRQCPTRNTGMVLALEFADAPGKGVVIGTTHMFWHPVGSYERTRQLAVLIDCAGKFRQTIGHDDWQILLAGDYNSECFDTPYLCASGISSSEYIDSEALSILKTSAAQRFADANELDPKAFGDSDDVVSKETLSDEEAQSRVDGLLQFYGTLDYRTKSLYGETYKEVHPENVHPKSTIGEPFFSNWAHKWRGLLDYIFVLEKKNVDKQHKQPSEIVSGVKVLNVLRMPDPKEMGPEPSGQPREGQYPSDHLCMMCTVSIE